MLHSKISTSKVTFPQQNASNKNARDTHTESIAVENIKRLEIFLQPKARVKTKRFWKILIAK